MRKLLSALGITAAITGPAASENGTNGKYETPQYDVVRTVGAAEIRSYAPYILAEVAVRGDQRRALNQGFRALAGYIFGGNDGGASVSMTSPVAQSNTIAMTAPVGQTGDADIWTVTFMMPSSYTMNTLPTPNNAAVRFSEVPARDMAVLTFSGRANTAALQRRTDELTAILAGAGLDPIGPPVFMFYDDPFTLPMARRNEVGFVLR